MIREMKDGKIVPSEKTDRMNDEARKLCNNRSNLEVGDVLFSGTGTIGETAVIEKEPSNWNIKEGVYAIKPNQTMIEPKLKEPETRKYLANAFRDGEIKTVGTDIDKLMPPVSRFGGGGRAQKKQGVIDKLKSFFDKFFGIGGSSMAEDDSK